MSYFYKIGDKVRILPINEAMSAYVFDAYQTGDLAEIIDYDESGDFVSDEDDFFKSPQYRIKVFNDDEVVAWVFESMLAPAESEPFEQGSYVYDENGFVDVYRPVGIVNGQKLYSIRVHDNLITKVCHEMDY